MSNTMVWYREALQVVYAHVRDADPDLEWPIEMVRLASILCAVRHAAQDEARIHLIAAKALETLPTERAEHIRQLDNFPSAVLRQDTSQPWPELPEPVWSEFDLPKFKRQALRDVRRMIDETGHLVMGVSYPEVEIMSWPTKQAVAAKINDGTPLASEESTMVDAEIAATGETADDWATNVLARAAAFMPAVGHFSGIRRAAGAAINDAIDADGVNAAVAQAKATLQAMLGQ